MDRLWLSRLNALAQDWNHTEAAVEEILDMAESVGDIQDKDVQRWLSLRLRELVDKIAKRLEAKGLADLHGQLKSSPAEMLSAAMLKACVATSVKDYKILLTEACSGSFPMIDCVSLGCCAD